MKDLDQLRKQINDIDDELVSLYLKRLAVAGEIGEAKAAAGKPVYDPEREKQVVYRLTEGVPEWLKLYVKELYDVIFSSSRTYQTQRAEHSSPVVEEIAAAVAQKREFPVSARVACQGIAGANSQLAAQKLFPISDITYFKNFDGVFSAVDKGFCEFGVLPIENSTAGSVNEVYDLMQKHRFYVVKTVKVRIDHCLCALPGASIKDIKRVVSHKQALAQCAGYLAGLKVETEEATNTAVAAKALAEGGNKTAAVLCSGHCADIYGLNVLARSVQDSDKNYTRFICITKKLRVYPGSDRISVTVNLDHTPGSLNRALSKFGALGLNLTKLESRPVVGSDFEFMFYFDFEGDIADKSVQGLLADLQNGSDKFTLLGAYKEIL